MKGQIGYLYQDYDTDEEGEPTNVLLPRVDFYTEKPDYKRYYGHWTKIVYFEVEDND